MQDLYPPEYGIQPVEALKFVLKFLDTLLCTLLTVSCPTLQCALSFFAYCNYNKL